MKSRKKSVKNVPSNLVDDVTMVTDKVTDAVNDISKVVKVAK